MKTASRFRADHLMYAADASLRNTIRTGITMTEPVDPEALREAPEHFEISAFAPEI